MSEPKHPKLSIRVMSQMMLDYFGRDGKRWRNNGECGNPNVGCCLAQATHHLFSYENEVRIDDAIRNKLCVSIPTSADREIVDWNDRQTWPTVRRLLNSIRDRRPYTGPL